MNPSEMRALDDEQLVHLELGLERTLMGHTLRHRLGKLEDTSVLGKVRRDIARAQTFISERERSQNAPRGSMRARHASTWKPEVTPAGAEAGAGFLKGILDGRSASE